MVRGRVLENVPVSTTPKWWGQGWSFDSSSERQVLKAASARIPGRGCNIYPREPNVSRVVQNVRVNGFVPCSTQVREHKELEH